MKRLLSLLGFDRSTPKSIGAHSAANLTTIAKFTDASAVKPSTLPCDESAAARVTATELWRLFDTNEADAERRFAQKTICVSGGVERVTREGATHVIDLTVSGGFGATVRCRAADAMGFDVEQLRRGDLVMVSGRRVLREHGRIVLEGALLDARDLTAFSLRPLL